MRGERERERLMREMGLTDEGESVCGVRDGLDRWRRERGRDVDGCWLCVIRSVVEVWCPLKCGSGVCGSVCVQCAVCSK